MENSFIKNSESINFKKYFPEIITNKNGCNIIINNKKIKLPHVIIQYSKIKKQDKEYLAKLKKNNIKIKYSRKFIGKNLFIFAYKIYAIKIYDSEHKKIIVNKILNKKNTIQQTKREEILKELEKNIIKKITSKLTDKASIFLDVLGSYLVYDSCEILSKKKIKKQEQLEYNEAYIIENKQPYSREYRANWKKSKTYKLNQLYKLKTKKDKMQWCYINSENEFIFLNQKYKIAKDLKVYKYKQSTVDRKPGWITCYKPDQILVFNKNGINYYYDMNINIIQKEKITRC